MIKELGQAELITLRLLGIKRNIVKFDFGKDKRTARYEKIEVPRDVDLKGLDIIEVDRYAKEYKEHNITYWRYLWSQEK